MTTVSMRDLLRTALRGGYAIGYFESWDQYSLESTIEGRQSLVAIEVNNGSLLDIIVGGTITNDGTVCLIAGAAPAPGADYTPISAGTWGGSDAYQAIGGTWDATGHTFAASPVQ